MAKEGSSDRVRTALRLLKAVLSARDSDRLQILLKDKARLAERLLPVRFGPADLVSRRHVVAYEHGWGPGNRGGDARRRPQGSATASMRLSQH